MGSGTDATSGWAASDVPSPLPSPLFGAPSSTESSMPSASTVPKSNGDVVQAATSGEVTSGSVQAKISEPATSSSAVFVMVIRPVEIDGTPAMTLYCPGRTRRLPVSRLRKVGYVVVPVVAFLHVGPITGMDGTGQSNAVRCDPSAGVSPGVAMSPSAYRSS